MYLHVFLLVYTEIVCQAFILGFLGLILSVGFYVFILCFRFLSFDGFDGSHPSLCCCKVGFNKILKKKKKGNVKPNIN